MQTSSSQPVFQSCRMSFQDLFLDPWALALGTRCWQHSAYLPDLSLAPPHVHSMPAWERFSPASKYVFVPGKSFFPDHPFFLLPTTFLPNNSSSLRLS